MMPGRIPLGSGPRGTETIWRGLSRGQEGRAHKEQGLQGGGFKPEKHRAPPTYRARPREQEVPGEEGPPWGR